MEIREGRGKNEREREKQRERELLSNITKKISLFIVAVLRRILIGFYAVRISMLAFEIGSSFPVRLRWIIDRWLGGLIP